MMPADPEDHRRILVIDDTEAIHSDFKKILGEGESTTTALEQDETLLFEASTVPVDARSFSVDSAYQGQEGLERVREALSADRPYPLAFVDVRMPPGWDGIETIEHIWREDADLEVVLCTAYSDYSWHETIERLGDTDRLLILKKPFEAVEVRQLAWALTAKWQVRNSLKNRTQRLMHERNLFRTLIDSLPDYIFVKDAHRRFVVTNAALARHLGVGNPEELVGKTQCELSPAGLAPQNSAEDEIIRSGQPVLNRDITERKMAEAKLRHKAFHDSLTGLPNRALFTERLERAHARKERRKSSLFGVMLLDIDRFKLVNDNLGHTVGDQFLCQVAGRLIACIRPGDTVARLGGDEFAILLEDLNGPAEAKAVAERLLEDLAVPFQLQEHKIATSASFGIALADPRRERAEELLRDADTAMYAARKLGKGRWEMFDPHMHKSTLAHLELEADLRAALERQEFLIHYQPIVDLTTGKIGGCEALLRWNHPQRDLIMPAKFLPLAEETGLIVPMGEWVLRTACAQNSAWQRAGYGLGLPPGVRQIV